jgi:uncharacterized protein YjgD (DUF1641 family)
MPSKILNGNIPMTPQTQTKDTVVSLSTHLLNDIGLNDPATRQGLTKLVDKLTPLIQTGNLENLIDLMSVVSDNITFLDEAMLANSTRAFEDILALGWTTGNAIRMANVQTEQTEQTPGLLQLMKSMNDPDVRRALHFVIFFLRIIGRQMKHDEMGVAAKN